MSKKHTPSETYHSKVFGSLTVVGSYRGSKYYYLKCVCVCGVEKDIREDHILSGRIVSCGCHKNEKARKRMTQHGRSYDTIHAIWCGIIQRCTNPNLKSYRLYGGRGIKVCKRWLDSFEDFLADMGERPDVGYGVDRIDGDGDYEPGNCRWATPKQNARNMSTNVFVEYGGERLCLAEWAERVGVTDGTIKYRIQMWGIERALTTPKLK